MHHLYFLRHLFILDLLNQAFQRGYDERERCAQLVTDIGKKAELQLIEFVLTPRVLLNLAHPVLIALPTLHLDIGQQQAPCQQQDIQHIGPRRQPEWRTNDNLQRRLVLAGEAIVVGRLHPQPVGARRQIGIGDTMQVFPVGQPILVKAFQLIIITRFLGQDIIVRGQKNSEDILLIVQHDFPRLVQRLCQDNPPVHRDTHFDFFIEQLQTGEYHPGHSTVVFDIARPDHIDAIQPACNDLARMQQFQRTLVEVTALQPVPVRIRTAIETQTPRLHIGFRPDADKPASHTGPQIALPVFGKPLHRLAGEIRIHRNLIQGILNRVIYLQSRQRGHPQPGTVVLIHLIDHVGREKHLTGPRTLQAAYLPRSQVQDEDTFRGAHKQLSLPPHTKAGHPIRGQSRIADMIGREPPGPRLQALQPASQHTYPDVPVLVFCQRPHIVAGQ